MIKKISLILLSICLFLSFNLCAVGAEPSATKITSPLSGEAVGEDFSEILFTAPEGAFVSVNLDGEEIFCGVSDGNGSVAIDEELSFGKHNLILTSVLEGTTASDSVLFSKGTSVSKTVEVQGNPHQESYEAGVMADGTTTVYAFSGKFPGRNGEDEGSVGFKIENLGGRTITRPTICYVFPLTEYKDDMVDVVKLSFDLKVTNAQQFGFEMRNGDSGWVHPGGSTVFFKNNYTISATGASYPNGEWMAMEFVFDVPAQTIAVWINGEKVISEYKAESHLRGLQYIRFLLEPRPNVAEQGYYIDNFKVTTEYRYRGFNDVSYKSGDVFENAVGDKISESFDEIRFKTDMVSASFSLDFTAKCFSDGRETKVEKTTFESVLNEESGLMENFLTVKLKNKLSGESALSFVFENKTNAGDPISFSKNVSLSTESFGVESVEYLVNDAPCISAGQLKAGDTLKANFNLRNYSSQSAVCVVGIYSGEKLVALSSKTAQDATCQVSALIPAGEESYRAECFMIDGYALRKPLSNTRVIGGSND